VRFISNMIDRWRVWNTLFDYPVYSPPFHDAEAVLSKKEIAANYEYFLAQKALRLEYLASYLRRFSIELRLARETLPALDRWLYRYGGHLIPSGGEVIAAMQDYEPAWVSKYHGLNIVNDIAIFAGDYIISKNKDVRWDVYYGDGKKRSYEEKGFGQPLLFGLPHPDCQGHYSMHWEIFDCCNSGRLRLRDGGRGPKWRWDVPDAVVRRLDYLTDPNPPPLPSFSQSIMGDVLLPSHEKKA